MSSATVLTDRFDRALLYATHVHGGQVCKATPVPYIAHLLAVAATVLEYEGSEDMAIAALLHDAVEDQVGNHDSRTFGTASAIESLTLCALARTLWSTRRLVRKKKTGRLVRPATSNTSIWSTKTLFSCPCLTRFTTLVRYFVIFENPKSAMPFGNDSSLPRKIHFGITARLRSPSRSD
jgi:HD domain